MTLIVACKVGSGIALGSDSRTQFGNFVSDSVDKIVRVGSLPLVFAAYGTTHFGGWSFERAIRSFATSCEHGGAPGPEEALRRVGDLAASALARLGASIGQVLGLVAAGLDTGGERSLWEASVTAGGCHGLAEVHPRAYGWSAWGSPQVVERLVLGRDPLLAKFLRRAEQHLDQAERYTLASVMTSLDVLPSCDTLPLRDAAGLVGFLVSTATDWYQFMAVDPVAPVGGPVMVATLDALAGTVDLDRTRSARR
ncbi:MAG: hypothetical protein ACYCTE_14465 [Acidimicrobiales bacterium]